jgi:hypothetical protein
MALVMMLTAPKDLTDAHQQEAILTEHRHQQAAQL